VRDNYLDGLRNDFDSCSGHLKRLKTELLKTKSPDMQSRIIKQIDSLANKMESNQKQSIRVAKSRTRGSKKKSKQSV